MKYILIADDEEEIITLYEEALSDVKDIKVISARDGAEAYSKSRNQPFDLIITDYRMPKLNGVQFIAALRANPLNSTCPIYIVTGYAQEVFSELKKERLNQNIKVIEKPINIDFIQELATNPEKHAISSPAIILNQTKNKTKNISLDVNFVNPYIDAVSETLRTFARVEFIKNQKPFLFDIQKAITVDISSKLSIESEHFNGFLILGFPEMTFLQTASELLCNSQISINNDNQNVISELNNIIFKKCKDSWDELGFSFTKALPTIETGKNHHLKSTEIMTSIVIPFETNYGSLITLICIKDGTK